MVGVIPKTALLLTKYDRIVGHFKSYSEVGHHLGVSIDKEGKITFMGKRCYPEYVLGDVNSFTPVKPFTPSEAVNDWCRCYMSKALPSHYTLYRYLV
jgi:hypothetical protein